MLQVMLSTVHAVKGLECVVCFVVGLDDRTWKTNFVPTTPAEAKQVSLLCQQYMTSYVQKSRKSVLSSWRVHLACNQQ